MSKARQIITQMKETKKSLDDLDYLELTDMSREELMKYSKEELISALKSRCAELFDSEKRIAELELGKPER